MTNSDDSMDMTMCPECLQYVRHRPGADTANCPFCETSFCPADVVNKPVSASAVSERFKTGIMAFSFVGASLLGTSAQAQDLSVEPEYGAPGGGFIEMFGPDDDDESDDALDSDAEPIDADDDDESDDDDGDNNGDDSSDS